MLDRRLKAYRQWLTMTERRPASVEHSSSRLHSIPDAMHVFVGGRIDKYGGH